MQAEPECSLPIANDILLKRSIMSNYRSLPSWWLIGRTYEEDYHYVYLVYKPLEKNYDKNFDGMDHVRKHLKSNFEAVIITREVNAKKVHYNVMAICKGHMQLDKLLQLHEKHTSRYYVYSTYVNKTREDIDRVHEYIIKESRTRYFYKNKDIYVYDKHTKRQFTYFDPSNREWRN